MGPRFEKLKLTEAFADTPQERQKYVIGSIFCPGKSDSILPNNALDKVSLDSMMGRNMCVSM